MGVKDCQLMIIIENMFLETQENFEFRELKGLHIFVIQKTLETQIRKIIKSS